MLCPHGVLLGVCLHVWKEKLDMHGWLRSSSHAGMAWCNSMCYGSCVLFADLFHAGCVHDSEGEGAEWVDNRD
jgi:hypothetical protein